METKGEKKTYKDCCKRFSNFFLKIFESKLYYHLMVLWTIISMSISSTIYYVYFFENDEDDVMIVCILLSFFELLSTYFLIFITDGDDLSYVNRKILKILKIIGIISSTKLYIIFLPIYYQIYYIGFIIAFDDFILFVLYIICYGIRQCVKSFIKECKKINTNV
jgi:hypothetical protein